MDATSDSKSLALAARFAKFTLFNLAALVEETIVTTLLAHSFQQSLQFQF